MSRMTPDHSRLERYALFAAIPTVGIGGGYALAGDSIIHYGGPAIEITRTFTTSYDGMFFSSGSGAVPGFDMAGINVYEREVNDGVTKEIREAGFGADDNKYFGVSEEFFGEMLQEGDQINGSGEWNESEVLIAGNKTVTSSAGGTIFEDSVGDWALGDGAEETRGFLAFHLEEGPDDMFGWLDVGWDGETLTIYDYAFNTDGSIAAGQTQASTVVPGAGGLAALAMGAAGMRRRRKKSA